MSWNRIKLSKVATFRLGKMLDKKKNKGDFQRYLANVNVQWGKFVLDELREMRFEQHELEKFGLKYGDIVMCEGGEPGRCAIWKDQIPGMMIQKALHRIRPNDCLNTEFLYYTFLHHGKTNRFSKLFTGSTIKHLPREKLALVEIDVPPLYTQQKIASILSAYDDLIENNHRRIQLLEQSAQMLYKEWFVRLRFPGHKQVKVINGVPEGWSRRRFGELINNLDRLRIPLSTLEREDRPGPYPYYGATKILSHIDDFIFDGRFLLIGEDGTVITDSGSPMLQLVEGKFWVSNHAHVVQGKLLSTEFLYCFMFHYPITPHITGVAQPKLSQSNLNRIELLVPKDEYIKLFDNFVNPLFQQTFNLKAQIEELTKARDLLLPRLMNGELDV